MASNSFYLDEMENWRLSKIEEELGKLNLDSSSHRATNSPLEDSHSNSPREDDDDEVKIIIRPAYKKPSSRSKQHDAGHKAAAVRRIKEKYDSPGAVTKVNGVQEQSSLNEVRSADHQPRRSWEHRPTGGDTARTTAPADAAGDHQTAQGLSVGNRGGENLEESGEVFSSFSSLRVQTIPVFPSIREHRSEEMSRVNGTHAGIRPSTAAKPLYSSFRGQIFPNSNERSNDYNLSQIDSKDHAMPPDSTDRSYYSLPPLMNFPVLHPSSTVYLQDHLHPVPPLPPPPPHDLSDFFPVPPPDFFSHGVGLELPTAQKHQPEIICTRQTRDYNSSALNVTYEDALPKCEDLVVVVNANGPSSQRIYDSTPLNYGEAKQQRLPEETPGSEEHFTSSHSDCYPRYGTLKATRHNPNSATTSGLKSDFSPPSGLCLTDEDRGQVELFYRSHKTKVFAARCLANLYFGSARRHSSVLPSGGPLGSAAAALEAPPDSWVFVKTGIPILVLDTGESRRQRRLHVILAERGSGFVLWRDTVDHLTTYSQSATEAGFHTMHLSKDHTKLAGLYFADPVHAGQFLDCLTGLTSDPNDPLLNLSLGAKRRKAAASTKRRKEKRRPIKREDISMPCCFNHVTKLDRTDGLNLLESDQQLHD